MPLNDHNNIELVPTTTKVPVPIVVVYAPARSAVSICNI